MLAETQLKNAPLGKKTAYAQSYTPGLLFPISRQLGRDKLKGEVVFDGLDIWNGTELSWLNSKGKPEIGLLQIAFPASSSHIVESKSLKLYLNSFSQSKFDSLQSVEKTIQRDLSQTVGSSVSVKVQRVVNDLPGESLDGLDVEIDTYQVCTDFLHAGGTIVKETLHSSLLKSNCLATGQPDWGSVLIRYEGPQINREGLLKYIVSFRNHSGFAEHCVEQIFHDLMERCKMQKLTVSLFYTRRGGLDINPFRSNFEEFDSCLQDERR